MKTREWVFVLFMTLTVILGLNSLQNDTTNIKTLNDMQNRFKGDLERLSVFLHNIDYQMSEYTQKMNEYAARIEELVRENERLRTENAALQDMVNWYDGFLDEKYDFSGDQKKYMEVQGK